MTVEAWVLHDTSQGADVVAGKGTCYSSACPFNLRITGGAAVCFDQGNGSSGQDSLCTTNSLVPVAQWTHLAITRSGTTRKIYINGVERATSNTQSKAPTSNTKSLSIGTSNNSVPNDAPFDGLIDEVRMYNRALTPSEILTDMNTSI
jgi:hypothetical protein